MNEENYWEKFTNSGKVEDYLSYTLKQELPIKSARQMGKSEGDNPYAGFYHSDGNDFKSGAYR